MNNNCNQNEFNGLRRNNFCNRVCYGPTGPTGPAVPQQ